jgi:tellurite resistance protein
MRGDELPGYLSAAVERFGGYARNKPVTEALDKMVELVEEEQRELMNWVERLREVEPRARRVLPTIYPEAMEG